MDPTETAQPVGLLLAAGRSTRFGGDKRWYPLAGGVPLVVASARRLRAALPDCVAVVRTDDTDLAARLREEGLAVVACADADTGMGSSLACGVRATPAVPGWIVALGDMPWIDPASTRAVAAALVQGALAAAPVYSGRRGHPVGFSARLRADLMALHGAQGARAILHRYAAQVARVAVDDPGVLLDLDRAAAPQEAG